MGNMEYILHIVSIRKSTGRLISMTLNTWVYLLSVFSSLHFGAVNMEQIYPKSE